MSMRRSFSRVQSKSQFPRWPLETALHDFYDFLFTLVTGLAQRPVPFIGVWPRRWTWALVLTHDVEAQVGYDKLPELLRVEVEAGYRSSWNFVPENRYVVDDITVETFTPTPTPTPSPTPTPCPTPGGPGLGTVLISAPAELWCQAAAAAVIVVFFVSILR